MNTSSSVLKQPPSVAPEIDPKFEEDFDEIEEGQLNKEERRIVALSILAQALALLVGLLLVPFGTFRFMLGTKPMEFSVDPFIYFGFYLIVLHMGLSVPLHFFAWPQISRFSNRFLRVMAIFLLTSAPLLSFAYYKTGKMASLGDGEIFLSILPASWLATLLFERTERRGIFTMVLAVGTYLPLFLLNDLMGSYSTYFTYASSWPAFYTVRYLAGGLSIAVSAWLLRRT